MYVDDVLFLIPRLGGKPEPIRVIIKSLHTPGTIVNDQYVVTGRMLNEACKRSMILGPGRCETCLSTTNVLLLLLPAKEDNFFIFRRCGLCSDKISLAYQQRLVNEEVALT